MGVWNGSFRAHPKKVEAVLLFMKPITNNNMNSCLTLIMFEARKYDCDRKYDAILPTASHELKVFCMKETEQNIIFVIE